LIEDLISCIIFLISSPIKYKHGTKIKVTVDERTTPKDSEITAGLRKFA
jgi:hypothetical protein